MTRILTTDKTSTLPPNDASVAPPVMRGRKSRKAEAQAAEMQGEALGRHNASKLDTETESEQSAWAQDHAGVETSPEATNVSAASQDGTSPKSATKAAMVIAVLRSENGATMDAIMAMTAWQAHSVRGFLSGTVKKTLGLTLARSKDVDGQQRYRIVEPASDTMQQAASPTHPVAQTTEA
jgi:hypothetical protein